MSAFDIIGPRMVGPSSSHTAEALRLGPLARGVLGRTPERARIGLHGSFATTYRGHGTDRAIAAGLGVHRMSQGVVVSIQAFERKQSGRLGMELRVRGAKR